MNYLFIITGPSACGKTTLLFRGEAERLWTRLNKYSSRERRQGDQHDDITDTCLPQTIYESSEMDYRYIMNGNIYAFKSSEILRTLENDNCALICSDLGIIRRLKEDPKIRERVVVLYVAAVPAISQITSAYLNRLKETNKKRLRECRDADSYNEIIQNNSKDFSSLESRLAMLNNMRIRTYFNLTTNQFDENENETFEKFSRNFRKVFDEYERAMPEPEKYKRRIRSIDKFHYKYIEEIGYFDYTILNFFDQENDNVNDEQMTRQVKKIVHELNNDDSLSPYRRQKNRSEKDKKYLFFICAPKMSGKAILLSNLNLLSKDKIEIIRKMAFRENKNNEEDIKRGKGDGYGLSETYWMFDNTEDKNFKEFKAQKDSYQENDGFLTSNYFHECLKIADRRVNNLVASEISRQNKDTNSKRKHDFTKWFWEFQGNYYAIDYNGIKDPSKHGVIISNMAQLQEARNFASKVKKVLVPIFLVYVDYKERSLEFHKSYIRKKHPTLSEGEVTAKAESLNKKIFDTIDDYYKNIHYFHHVILNNGVDEDVHDQISNIIRLYIN